MSFSSTTARTEDAKVQEFKVGQATVWAIGDAIQNHGANLFSGTDPEALAEFIPPDGVPSAVMVFLIKVEDELILVETGWGKEETSRLFDGLNQIGVEPGQITMILLTHMHPDHIGGMLWRGEKAFPSARVLTARHESEFWLDRKNDELYPGNSHRFELVWKVFGIYESPETFEFDSMVAPGIRALDVRGHTPGQAAFLLESEGERLLIWGDTIHAAALQFPCPDINTMFDVFPEASAATRVRLMTMAADENLPIAGIHLPFPGIGTVERRAEGGFKYISR